tara:strand:+ start:354 stop:647 length:294 start_codon:yes stop_codon:yes gene_type:complete
VPQRLLKKKLADTVIRLKQLQDELKVAEEQLVHFSEEADDARIRSLVSETPVADQKHREANKHAESMRSYKDDLQQKIARIEALQNDLLDQLDASDD